MSEKDLKKVNINSRLERIEEFLYFGNGDSLKFWMGEISSKMEDVECDVKEMPSLKIEVEKHISEPHIWQMIKSPKFWTIFIVILISIDEAARYAPPLLNALFILIGINIHIPIIGVIT
jgi:hypothetical protein